LALWDKGRSRERGLLKAGNSGLAFDDDDDDDEHEHEHEHEPD
jgi:hypothetical protein